MPIYEFQCDQCQNEFEVLVINSETSVVCDKCGSEHITKKFSSFSASVSGSRALPCSDGACPSETGASGCAGGGCPFS